MPSLDFDDRTLGRVKNAVRMPARNIRLIVPYGGFLGWGRRLVAVPVEAVAIAGRQLAALDMTRAEFDAAPAWHDPESRSLQLGFKNPKWITAMEATNTFRGGYWEDRGFNWFSGI